MKILELTISTINEKATIIAENINLICNLSEGGTAIYFELEDWVNVVETREEITAMLRGDLAKEPQQDELSILTEGFDRFEFTLRTLNCLRSENIETIGQLIGWKPGEILGIRNLGKKSLTEIIDRLASVGLSLAK